MAPKKQKMALADFMADEATGKVDWADDFDDIAAAPMPKDDRGMPRRGTDWLSSMPDRVDRDRSAGPGGFGGPERSSAYPPREELPLPTQPPYTAFVGNLSFDVTDADIEDFFTSIPTSNIRLVSGADGRPKGFGYVEFETLDGLKSGLALSGAQLTGRTVRVSVAEPREARGPGFSSVAEEATQWRRAAPLPPQDDFGGRRGPGAGGDRPGYNRYESGTSGFDNMDVGPGGGRSGFGSRFTPSAPREPREPRREPLEPTAGDNASDWRTGKPVEASSNLNSPVSRRPSASPAEGASRSFRRHGDATEVDEKFASQDRLGFGSKFSPTPPDSPSVQKRPGFGFDRRNTNSAQGGPGVQGETPDNWRSARRPSGQNAKDGATSPSEPSGEPAQRKKLELKPRSTPVGGEASATVTSPTSGGSNPFGAARPVDASERQREIEAKMQERDNKRKEEDRVRREKNKAEKTLDNVPTGPKADRAKGSAAAPRADASTASSPAATATTNGAASTPKSPPPTGAWGGGRKPSGALAGGPNDEKESPAAEKEAGDKAVEEVTKAVEASTLEA